MDIVIVGGGAAGLAAAKWSRKFWPAKSVSIIEEGRAIGCCRPLLPQFLAGQVNEEKVYQQNLGDDPGLKILTGQKVIALDRKRQRLFLEDGGEISYERLLLAPGGRPISPQVEGINKSQGIFALRNFPEARKARAWLNHQQKIIIIGGGLVGVKTAIYLRIAGYDITLVEKEDRLLPQALTEKAARYIEDYLRQLGIKIFLGVTLSKIEAEKGQIKKAYLGKRWLSCDTLLLAIGSVPNIYFLRESDLLDEGKLIVYPTLQTKDPCIFAAGDAITLLHPEVKKLSLWTWPQAAIQGKLAATNFYQANPQGMRILTKANSLNLAGLPLNIIEGSKEGTQEIFYYPPEEKFFRQIFFKEKKIAGGVLFGNISRSGLIQHMVISERENFLNEWELVKGSYHFMSSSLWAKEGGRRKAYFIMGEGKEKC